MPTTPSIDVTGQSAKSAMPFATAASSSRLPVPLPARILVLGGTGFVGQALCARLAGLGVDITVPSRQPQRARELSLLPNVRLVRAQISEPAQLAALVCGHDAVINLVAILHGSAQQFTEVHERAVHRLAQACASAGVRRVVHVSALGVGSQAPSQYLRSKAAGEAVWRASQADWTILRPSVIFGQGDRFLNLFATALALAPVFPLAGADARFQPVWLGDVVEAIVRSLQDASSVHRIYECAGPTVYTLRELVHASGVWSGHPRPIVALPPALAQIQAWVLEHLPGEPLMSRDNLASMRAPNVASGTLPSLSDLGIVPAALEAIAPAYLRWRIGLSAKDMWRARH